MVPKEIVVTTGAIEAVNSGWSIGNLSDALDAARAQIQASGEDEITFTVKVVRHDKVYTDEQRAALVAEHKAGQS